MNGIERAVVLALAIIGVFVLAVIVINERSERAQKRRAHEIDLDAMARSHELELADREVMMWKMALDKPVPTMFQQRRTMPKLVGHSQVLERVVASFASAQQDMPMAGQGMTGEDRAADPEPDFEPTLDTTPAPSGTLIEPCGRAYEHPGHRWIQRPQMEDRWCDGLDAHGKTPYTGGWVEGPGGVRKGTGANAGLEERLEP